MTKIQVTKIRRNGTVSAKYVADDGRYIHAKKRLCVIFPANFKGAVQSASVWEVSGTTEPIKYSVNDIPIEEDCLTVSEATLLKPSTRLLESWLMKNIQSVGQVKAGKFARNIHFQDYAEGKDIDGLLTIPGMNEDIAREIISKYPDAETIEALNWFAQKNLPIKIALRLCETMQGKTVEAVSSNPFLLMKFDVGFFKCLELAKDLGYSSNDDIVQSALSVDIIKSYCERTGSTVIPRTAFASLALLRGVSDPKAILRASGRRSEVACIANGYTYEGAFLVEYEVAAKIMAAHKRNKGDLSFLAGWEESISNSEIEKRLSDFEKTIPFHLTSEQKSAIKGSIKSNVCCLSGGAGTGKTTILKAILEVIEKVSFGIEIIQLALSGRAAQRMAESTGRPAHTIAKFCIDMKNKSPAKRPEHCVVVIDEASMVDVYSMHKLLTYLHPSARFIFVGDDQQLPPVGGGLVYHALLQSNLPRFDLKQVKRQSDTSDMHRFATAIRQDVYSPLDKHVDSPNADCTIVNSDDTALIKDLFLDAGHDTMILCATQNGKSGVRQINDAIQRSFGFDRAPIVHFDDENGLCDYISEKGNRFYVEDPILITKNAYDIDVRNGDIGRIIEAYFEPDETGSNGILELNGRHLDITPELLEKMDLAYAITIHKSQGSQWRNTIAVINKSSRHMFDKTLLYTAVTRATNSCIIACPNEDLIKHAIARGSLALQRTVAINEFM